MTPRNVPKTMTIALHRSDSDKSKQVMEKEYEKLDNKDILKLVRLSDVPHGVWIYSGKWVYDSKEGYEPTDDRAYKADGSFWAISLTRTCCCSIIAHMHQLYLQPPHNYYLHWPLPMDGTFINWMLLLPF